VLGLQKNVNIGLLLHVCLKARAQRKAYSRVVFSNIATLLHKIVGKPKLDLRTSTCSISLM
jgi:hypothetical protein